MIVLVNTGGSLDRFGPSELVGRLTSPRSWGVVRPGDRWAADNDAFGAWDEERFMAMLKRHEGVPGCLFVTAPDVVGNAKETAARFWDYHLEITGRGYPIALVGQDGAENLDLEWSAFDAFFIGGSTAWKLSAAAADLAAEARRRGKWLHMGRVNSQRRQRMAWLLHADSIDGTRWSRFKTETIKRDIPYLTQLQKQGKLF